MRCGSSEAKYALSSIVVAATIMSTVGGQCFSLGKDAPQAPFQSRVTPVKSHFEISFGIFAEQSVTLKRVGRIKGSNTKLAVSSFRNIGSLLIDRL